MHGKERWFHGRCDGVVGLVLQKTVRSLDKGVDFQSGEAHFPQRSQQLGFRLELVKRHVRKLGHDTGRMFAIDVSRVSDNMRDRRSAITDSKGHAFCQWFMGVTEQTRPTPASNAQHPCDLQAIMSTNQPSNHFPRCFIGLIGGSRKL